MSTITHVVLAVVLPLFLVVQARFFVFVMRCRKAESTGCRRRASDVLWTSIPLIIVLALAARSWVTVFDLQRAAAAAAVSAAAPSPGASPK